MDVRLNEFERLEPEYVPELNLLELPILNSDEKEFLRKFYNFIEEELVNKLKSLENLNYMAEEQIQEKKKDMIINIMKILSTKGYYSTIGNNQEESIGRITRNALIALALCGGFYSENLNRYIPGNWSVEMGRLAGGTLYCNPVNYKANEYQRKNFLYPVTKDGAPAASAMTEFNAGSDIFRLECKFKGEGDNIVVDGKKLFITNGMIADYVVLYGRLEGSLRALLINTEHQQLENFKSSRVRMFGMKDAFVSRLVFDGTVIPKMNLMEGDGLDIMFHQLTEERLVISAEAIGDIINKTFYSHAWAKKRQQFERKLNQFQIIRIPITEGLRKISFYLSALINYTREMDSNSELGRSKLMASSAMGLKIDTCELAFDNSNDLYRTMGGRAFTEQYSNQFGLLDAFCMLHGGGSHYVLADAESRRFFKTK
ncbi:MAG: acyl-CoA dehydrogenase [Candidatus Lokiarchaeota archaeon]